MQCDGIADATLLVATINQSIISYSDYPLILNEETTLYIIIIISLYSPLVDSYLQSNCVYLKVVLLLLCWRESCWLTANYKHTDLLLLSLQYHHRIILSCRSLPGCSALHLFKLLLQYIGYFDNTNSREMIWVGCNLEHFISYFRLLGLLDKIVHHESRLSMYRGSAGLQPLRISRILAMAEFSVVMFCW